MRFAAWRSAGAAAAAFPAALPAAPAAGGRAWEIDALRGLMLVLMTLTHLPTRLTDPLGQPFGFVSAAEGFVLLSAFVVGRAYGRIALRDGVVAMRRAFWQRALRLWLVQALSLAFLFTVVAGLARRSEEPAVRHLLDFFLAQPGQALLAALLLVYEPPLLDILPMYILFMLLSPWVLALALRHGWALPCVASATCWAAAQFGAAEALHAALQAATGLAVPWRESGAFNAFAWQALWIAGLWLGSRRQAAVSRPLRLPPVLVALAVALALAGLAWRQLGAHGQAPFGGDVGLNLLFDKWRLGPLRLLNLWALALVVLRFGPALAARLPRPRWLEAMGRASLPVFCAHLAVVLLVLAVFGDSQTARPAWGDAVLLLAVFGLFLAIARAAGGFGRRAA